MKLIRSGVACLLSTALCAAALSLPAWSTATAQTPPTFAALDTEYQRDIRPLAQKFCLNCHSTAQQEGELDLEQFSTVAEIRKGTSVWLKVAEFLDNGEMPPKDAKQPTPEQRKALRGFVQKYLDAEALASAGDPGPVVLRRLNNAEYTYTIRDLTGVPLSPAREFPVDSAAGEGFTNTGNALVMSPALLTKYFDAAKGIADHAVLLPNGFHWSVYTTRSDWTNDSLARIRSLYSRYTANQGASQVNLQGIVFNTNDGGRLPVEQYLAVTLTEREALESGRKSIADVARDSQLNPKYLGLLWNVLHERTPSLLLARVQEQWRKAKPADAAGIAVEISRWQAALVKFQSVGHMKSWMAPVDPLVPQQELKFKFPATEGGSDVTVFLTASDVGDGTDRDFVLWDKPRLVAPGRPDLLLRDVRDFTRDMSARRANLFASAAKTLQAAAEAAKSNGTIDRAALATKYQVDADALAAWFDYLGIGGSTELKLDLFANKQSKLAGYEFVNGWGTQDLPSLVANSSDNHVRIPGNLKGHGVCVHPSPTLSAAAGWRSPIDGTITVDGAVLHAHPECGNGVTWSVELRRGATRQKLASGVAHGGKPVPFGPIENIAVHAGDLVSLLIGPRDGNHSCDLTDIELNIAQQGTDGKKWSLTGDVTGDIHAGNPHADKYGNARVWNFYSEPVSGGSQGPVIPAGSLLARWQSAADAGEQTRLAQEVEKLLKSGAPADPKSPDAVLYKQLASLGGPLLAAAWRSHADGKAGTPAAKTQKSDSALAVGPNPALFGKHPNGSAVDAASLCVKAPAVVEFRLPADLIDGAELVTTGRLHPETSEDGSVQLQIATTKPESLTGLRPETPILFSSATAQNRFMKAFADFRQWFPPALCYTKIVPVDEVVTLTLFHREDEPLERLMLNEQETAELNRLWNELHFVAHDALTLVDAYAQLMEYATQDSDPGLFEPFRKPIHDRAAAFKQELLDAEPSHLEALIAFAGKAYRRPLTEAEAKELRSLYRKLREQELPHDEAFRFTLARVFVAPAFLYRLEQAPPGTGSAPISDFELANRLSYFLWSSMPDDELQKAAGAGKLRERDVLTSQAKRMLRDPKMRRLATEFACQWLHIYDFDTLDEKSERHFPEFNQLRGDMYEEAIAFFTDLFQRDGSMWEIFDADHTFVNDRLAAFYTDKTPIVPATQPAGDVPADIAPPQPFRRLDGVKGLGRGGILGFSATLAKQSGASRTSPILRGNWVSEVLLGERLPRPPKDVPRLPEDETATEGLTVRQLVEMHSSDVRCSGCHVRIDPMGFALEGYDPIGRKRDKDLAGRPIDVLSTMQDGTRFDGLDGLRQYLLTSRRSAVQRQFCKKLLGYALGRGVQLSDEPLLKEIQSTLDQNNGRISAAIELIVLSRQFREIRGRDTAVAENSN